MLFADLPMMQSFRLSVSFLLYLSLYLSLGLVLSLSLALFLTILPFIHFTKGKITETAINGINHMQYLVHAGL